MKILHLVESYYPSLGGMQEVVKQLSERIVTFGHEVFVGTSFTPNRNENIINGVAVEGFKISGNEVNGYIASNEEIARFQDFVVNSPFDVVVLFAAQQWSCDLILPVLDKISAKKIFIPTGFSGLHNPNYKEYFEKMKGLLPKFDMNIFLANDYRDINFAKENNVKNLTIIPNGADEREFMAKSPISFRKKLRIGPDQFLIIHVGSHTNVKGHAEALKIYLRSDVKNSVFAIIGNVYSKRCYWECRIKAFFINALTSKKVLILNLSREETVSAYKQADLFLFPSNIECSPIVLFEACASRTPFLVTDVGNSKEIIEWTKGGVLLPTRLDKRSLSRAIIKESSKLLSDLWRQPEKRKILASEGFKSWEEKFSWKMIARQYEELYNSVLTSKK